jgi:hypothetical protein
MRTSTAPIFAVLANEHYERKRIEGLAENSLRDMRDKLELHLLPFVGDRPVDEFDEDLIEAYIAHKQGENERTRAAEDAGEPLSRGNGQRIKPVAPATINAWRSTRR